MALDYGYTVRIQSNGTSNPSAVPTNQWQRKLEGQTEFVDLPGETSETYLVDRADQSALLRLKQSFNGAPAYSNELQVTTEGFEPTVTLFGDTGTTWTYKWHGGILAPNGKIYCVPYNNSRILVIDPSDDSYYMFGNFSGSYRWDGAVLAPDGKIYCIPSGAREVLCIDPSNDTTSTFGTAPGNYAYSGGALAPNGKIICVPHNAAGVMEIDPVNRTTSYWGSSSTENIQRWVGGVLAPNGKVYGIPRNAGTILEMDPVNRTTSTFGTIDGSSQFEGGVLGKNGKIYGVPHWSTSVVEIDTNTRTISNFGHIDGDRKWSGGCMAPNGKIYCADAKRLTVLEIDPESRSLKEWGQIPYDQAMRWYGLVLTPTGMMYGIPNYNKAILKVDIGAPAATGPKGSETWPMPGLPGNVLDPRSPYFNKM